MQVNFVKLGYDEIFCGDDSDTPMLRVRNLRDVLSLMRSGRASRLSGHNWAEPHSQAALCSSRHTQNGDGSDSRFKIFIVMYTV